MKIKEITEGILDKVADKVASKVIPNKGNDSANPYGAFAQQIDKNPYGSFSQQAARAIRGAGEGNPFTQYLKVNSKKKQRDGTSAVTDTPKSDADTSTDTSADTPKDAGTGTQRKSSYTGKPFPWGSDPEAEKANANIKSKIDYLVKNGVLQSGRITDTEKQYIDSVDVYVDPNKFANADPEKVIIKAKPPHVSLYAKGGSVTMPLSAWQEALGRDGSGLKGYIGFNLTPAGWWSDDYKAYVNPRNKLDDLITSYQK